jgi:hypothetical protein
LGLIEVIKLGSGDVEIWSRRNQKDESKAAGPRFRPDEAEELHFVLGVSLSAPVGGLMPFKFDR